MKVLDDFDRRFLAMQKLRNDLIKERESLYISDDINGMGSNIFRSRCAFIEGEIIKGLLEGHKLIIVGEPCVIFNSAHSVIANEAGEYPESINTRKLTKSVH